jgi:hypothetical protein
MIKVSFKESSIKIIKPITELVTKPTTKPLSSNEFSKPKSDKFVLKMGIVNKFVPKEFEHLVKHCIVVVPTKEIFGEYDPEKLLKMINNSKNTNVNTMHKRSYDNPLSGKQIINILEDGHDIFRALTGCKIRDDITYYGGFAICYGGINAKLDKHVDDSVLTINMCLENSATGNEVVFEYKDLHRNFTRSYTVNIPEGHTLIHPGNIPHYTKSIASGCRKNIVMWFR